MIAFPHLRKWMLALVILTVPTLVHANIGEDISQLRKRYGSAKEVANQMLFEKDGFSIGVSFDGEFSAMEVFTPTDSKPEMTHDDINTILAREGDGQPWKPVQSKTGKETWVSPDGKLVARLIEGDKPHDKYLMVMLNSNA